MLIPLPLEVAADELNKEATVEPEDVNPTFDPLLLESYKAANLSMKERSFAGLLKSDIFISAECALVCRWAPPTSREKCQAQSVQPSASSCPRGYRRCSSHSAHFAENIRQAEPRDPDVLGSFGANSQGSGLLHFPPATARSL